MQLTLMVCIVLCCSLLPNTLSVIQYKKRAPVAPHRIIHTHPPMYTKSKWPMPPRPPARPYMRPIPVHMASYKVPIIARPPKTSPPSVPSTPLIFPSAIWKNPTAVYRPPVEKPFLTSPPVTQPYEFQLNKEPVHNIPTIKQIGEKGPIHTIPAPNLSPADKPNVIYEQPAQKHTYQYVKEPEISPNAISLPLNAHSSNSLLGAQALPLIADHHQYQVTENAESGDQLVHQQNPFTSQKIYYAPDPDQSNLFQKLSQFTDSSSSPNNVKFIQQDMYANSQQLQGAHNLPISAQELYQLLNGIPQQHLVDNYGMSVLQPQQYVQQTQNYQQLLNNPQLIQSASPYFNQIPDTMSQQMKDNFKPQFHTFNYEEQSSHSAPRKEFVQSRVTADYNIEPDAAESYSQITVQNPQEALAQSQYVQQYFTNRVDNNVSNNENNDLETEQEGSVKESQILNQLHAKNEISPTMFYSSLPNKKAAETLATLQAAGSINSSILKLKQQQQQQNEENSSHRVQMRIYVPDEDNYDDMESQAFETTHLQQNANSRNDQNVEYDDYSGEDDSSSLEKEKVQDSEQFGNKMKSKTMR